MTKMMFSGLCALVLLIGLSFTEIHSLQVDTNKSTIKWEGNKVTGSHQGTIQIHSGSLDIHDGYLTGGTFTIDMSSIKCTDLEGGGAAKLEGHLKSPDFFGVEANPTAKLAITKVSSRGTTGDFKVVGDLTIKNITKEIKFNAQLQEDMGATTVTADITIDRSDFDVRYGSGSFFDNLGDKTIYDDFTLKVKVVGM